MSSRETEVTTIRLDKSDGSSGVDFVFLAACLARDCPRSILEYIESPDATPSLALAISGLSRTTTKDLGTNVEDTITAEKKRVRDHLLHSGHTRGVVVVSRGDLELSSKDSPNTLRRELEVLLET